jgi:hypothetical protein
MLSWVRESLGLQHFSKCAFGRYIKSQIPNQRTRCLKRYTARHGRVQNFVFKKPGWLGWLAASHRSFKTISTIHCFVNCRYPSAAVAAYQRLPPNCCCDIGCKSLSGASELDPSLFSSPVPRRYCLSQCERLVQPKASGPFLAAGHTCALCGITMRCFLA